MKTLQPCTPATARHRRRRTGAHLVVRPSARPPGRHRAVRHPADDIPAQRTARAHDEACWFRTADLAEFVARQIKALRYENDAELRLPNLTVGDHGFIGGYRAARLQRHDDDDEVIGQHAR